ncbi:endogenous retrovirus group PABLB member 1 Env polyprotein-like [Melanotaenia boesemani]|uniref:endogenous retrovirus group PABLB member 1 Env polyprotein-like n=1 Tax=Melanotaenia boesemani TaxID=1250792 RepID=UPI001C03F4F3|nr:endogenous retrovirus group PABLB member 1 Env polyprotein-like [Melanotaenia boesemani]
MLSFLAARSVGKSNSTHFLNASLPLKFCPWMHDFSFQSIRFHGDFSSNTDHLISKSVMPASSVHAVAAPLCFEMPCFDVSLPLGVSNNCNHTILASCGFLLLDRPPCNDPNYTLRAGESNVNLSWFGLATPSIPYLTLLTPSPEGYSCPTNMVWVCGLRSFLYLPRNWCGRCYLAYLIPHLRVLSDLSEVLSPPHRTKRARISTTNSVFGSIFPHYGTVNNALQIDALAVDLENLTSLVTKGFDALTPELKALRVMTLQNRMALDFLLAEKGGTCKVIGDECCTFIPDMSTNLSSVQDHLRDLLSGMEARDSSGSSSELWSWFQSGGWWHILLAVLGPIFAVLIACWLVAF